MEREVKDKMTILEEMRYESRVEGEIAGKIVGKIEGKIEILYSDMALSTYEIAEKLNQPQEEVERIIRDSGW
ncbi:MAG: hypothetical protein FWG65_12315 [Turicibacter sp.]|nr:hypothetical protein [Turicibacter sp.]